jgi:ABC-2 type transport system permease protein
MKVLAIAIKDVRRNLRSGMLLVMMFAVPLLVTALMYFAFGRSGAGDDLAAVHVQVVDLDAPPTIAGDVRAGARLVEHLASPDLAEILTVRQATDPASARAAVDRGETAVAVIVPENLSAAAVGAASQATVELYSDPTLSVGPDIVREVVTGFLDGFNGSRIAADVVLSRLQAAGRPGGPAQARQAATAYAAWFEAQHDLDASRLAVRTPGGEASETGMAGMLGLVLTGMMIFFVFFTGANTATSIVREHEEGTLARLHTTPTESTTVLTGKFGAIAATLVVQVLVLVAAGALVFGIEWGGALSLLLSTVALVATATGFGLWLMSLVRSSRQSGPVIGVVVTVTGMAGGLMTTGFTNLPASFDRVTLVTPQGWVLRMWKLGLAQADPAQLMLPFLVCLVVAAALFALGARGMRRRFARGGA